MTRGCIVLRPRLTAPRHVVTEPLMQHAHLPLLATIPKDAKDVIATGSSDDMVYHCRMRLQRRGCVRCIQCYE